jgi:hypothetical protein
MKNRVDYKFVEKASSDFYSIQLLTGKYTGVIYTYGIVKFRDDLTVSFDYKIEEILPIATDKTMTIPGLNANSEFKDYIAKALEYILGDGIQKDIDSQTTAAVADSFTLPNKND